jgi:hypothetical protein
MDTPYTPKYWAGMLNIKVEKHTSWLWESVNYNIKTFYRIWWKEKTVFKIFLGGEGKIHPLSQILYIDGHFYLTSTPAYCVRYGGKALIEFRGDRKKFKKST